MNLFIQSSRKGKPIAHDRSQNRSYLWGGQILTKKEHIGSLGERKCFIS